MPDWSHLSQIGRLASSLDKGIMREPDRIPGYFQPKDKEAFNPLDTKAGRPDKRFNTRCQLEQVWSYVWCH